MEDRQFKYELLKLAWAKFSIGVAYMDTYLQNFSKVWKGPRDETGMLDAGPPEWWVKKYFALQKQGEDDAEGTLTLEASGLVVVKDPDTGNVWLRNAGGYIPVLKGDVDALVTFLQAPKPQSSPSPETSTLQTGQTAWQFDPVLKARHEQSMKAMESWARNSSRHWPNHK